VTVTAVAALLECSSECNPVLSPAYALIADLNARGLTCGGRVTHTGYCKPRSGARDSVRVYGWTMGEPATLLGFFLSAAGAFGKLVGWLSNENRKSRERIATYFDQIAACMREVAERIEAGDPPRDTCRRLAVYADELQQILSNRDYLIASSDASIEATRWRLYGEIKRTEAIWGYVGEAVNRQREAERARVAKEVVAKVKATSKAGSHSISSGAAIDRLTYELEKEFVGRIDLRGSVQQIWDAAGEFTALADALRAH
jgi:hypothetical protein